MGKCGGSAPTRRSVLVLGALAAAGCSSPIHPEGAPVTGTGSPSGVPTAGTGSATSPTPSASVASPTPAPTPSVSETSAVPGRTEVLAEFGSRKATAFGLEVPGVTSRLPRGAQGVALTFDACGGGGGGDGVDRRLIDLLRRHRVPATLFLNTRWIAANGSYARELAADPLFELANHGHRHLPLSVDGRSAYGIRGTADLGQAYDEVEAAVGWFVEHTGGPPRWFRSGTAHVDDVCAAMAKRVGQPIAGFSVNGDAGATLSARQVAATVSAVRARDIVISHMNRPHSGTGPGYAACLPGLLERGVRFTQLSGAGA